MLSTEINSSFVVLVTALSALSSRRRVPVSKVSPKWVLFLLTHHQFIYSPPSSHAFICILFMTIYCSGVPWNVVLTHFTCLPRALTIKFKIWHRNENYDEKKQNKNKQWNIFAFFWVSGNKISRHHQTVICRFYVCFKAIENQNLFAMPYFMQSYFRKMEQEEEGKKLCEKIIIINHGA